MEILYESDAVVVINKPAGMLVHSNGRDTSKTVADWVAQNYPGTINVGEPATVMVGKEKKTLLRPGIVHRLDADTTGCLIIAKTQTAYEDIKVQFKDRNVGKVYHAFAYGIIKQASGSIVAEIGRSKNDIRQYATGKVARGQLREASTDFKVLWQGQDGGDQFILFELYPKTGRTHQIRVHAKHIHHPIVADALYAGKLAKQSNQLGFTRQALHARQISFNDNQVAVTVEASYPSDFEQAIKNLAIFA